MREAASTSRRERPWAIVHRAVRINSRQADPQAALASAVLLQTMLERWLDRARQVFGSPSMPEWAPGKASSSLGPEGETKP